MRRWLLPTFLLALAACGGGNGGADAGQEPGEVLPAPDTVVVPRLAEEACDSVLLVLPDSPEGRSLIVGLLATEPELGAAGEWPGAVEAGAIIRVDGWYLAELRLEDRTRPGVWAVQLADSTYRYAGARWVGTATDPREIRRALHAALPAAPAALVGCYDPGAWFEPPPVARTAPGGP
ncbi:MAG: hypothetical protein WEB88_06495 [Gemmatimonadota bacterium]